MLNQNGWTQFARALICTVVVGVAAGCASTRTQESPAEYASDAAVTARVKARILAEPTLKVAQINVETFRGAVQLSGFVEDAAMVKRAEEVARATDGVRMVRNDIRLRAAVPRT